MNSAIHSVIVSSTVMVGQKVLQRNPSVEESKSVRILGVVFTNDPVQELPKHRFYMQGMDL